MPIILNDNIDNRSPKILDARYSIGGVTPYASVADANLAISTSYRAIGLTVNVAGVEYWYKNGTTDIDLVIKSSGALNGLSLDGSNVILGGALDRNTSIDVNGFVFKVSNGANDNFVINNTDIIFGFGKINPIDIGSASGLYLFGEQFNTSSAVFTDNLYLFGKNITIAGTTTDNCVLGYQALLNDSIGVFFIGGGLTSESVNGALIFGASNELASSEQSNIFGNFNVIQSSLYSFVSGAANTITDCERINVIGNDNTITSISDRIIIGNTDKNVFINTTNGYLGVNIDTPTASIHSVGIDSTSVNFAQKVQNSALVNLMSIRNDGYTIINGLSVGKGISQLASNVVFGVSALNVNTTGFNNFAFGTETLFSNTTGQNNVGIGHNVLRLNVSGNDNVGIGTQVLRLSTSSQNTGIGAFSLFALTSGVQNTAIGNQSMLVATTATLNTALGYYSLRSNISGQRNVAIGWNALDLATNSFNVAVGYRAGGNITIGEYNTAIGNDTMATVTTGNYNTFIGRDTGRNIDTGSRNTIIGASVTGLTGALSDTVILADGGGVIRYYSNSSGDNGFGTILPTAKLHVKGIDSTSTNYVLKLDNLANTNLVGVKNTGLVGFNSTVNSDSQFQLSTIGSVGFSILNYSAGNQQMYFDACFEANNIIAKNTHSFSILNVSQQLRFGRASGLTIGSAFGYSLAMTIDAVTGYVGVNTGGGTVTSPLQIGGLPTYLSNATAVSAGLTVGALYIRTGHGLDVVV